MVLTVRLFFLSWINVRFSNKPVIYNVWSNRSFEWPRTILVFFFWGFYYTLLFCLDLLSIQYASISEQSTLRTMIPYINYNACEHHSSLLEKHKGWRYNELNDQYKYTRHAITVEDLTSHLSVNLRNRQIPNCNILYNRLAVEVQEPVFPPLRLVARVTTTIYRWWWRLNAYEHPRTKTD